MNFEKKLDDWVRRGLELEMQGLEPGIIGTKARFERLKGKLRKARVCRDAVVRSGKSSLKMSVVGKPEIGQDHVRLGLILELPLEGGGRKLSDKAGSVLKAMVNNAMGDLKKSSRAAPRRPRRSGSA
jgi:hypothetical protein